jgi:hypothetical protein
MTRENYLKLKNELKQLAIEIKEAKKIRKEVQKAYQSNKLTKENITMMNSAKLLEMYENNAKKFDASWGMFCQAMNDVYSRQNEYRYKHIVISLARGKTYEQIEPKVRKGNEPNWKYIDDYKKEYGFDEPREELVAKTA